MIRQSSLRWRLVACFVATMLVALAVVFVLVYEQTGSQLRAQTDKTSTVTSRSWWRRHGR